MRVIPRRSMSARTSRRADAFPWMSLMTAVGTLDPSTSTHRTCQSDSPCRSDGVGRDGTDQHGPEQCPCQDRVNRPEWGRDWGWGVTRAPGAASEWLGAGFAWLRTWFGTVPGGFLASRRSKRSIYGNRTCQKSPKVGTRQSAKAGVGEGSAVGQNGLLSAGRSRKGWIPGSKRDGKKPERSRGSEPGKERKRLCQRQA